jgi:hypothetical protein
MDEGRAVEAWKASPSVCLAPTVRESPTHSVVGQEFGRRNRISNRNWPKNRTCRKQTTKPCLTETRIDTRHFEFSSHFVAPALAVHKSRTIHHSRPPLRQGTAFHPEPRRRAAVPNSAQNTGGSTLVAEATLEAARTTTHLPFSSVGAQHAAPGTDTWLISNNWRHRCGGRFLQFLTGSGSQTEFDVTHSKQTTEKFLTGARMHIRNFNFSHDSAAQTANRKSHRV